MAQPKLELTYFDIRGGRAEPARLAMVIGGIDWDDNRISFQKFSEMKDEFPFGRVPVLEVDGVRATHSNGINRYVGKLAGLYPDDPVQAMRCDEVMGAVEDAVGLAVATFSIKDEAEKKAAREKLAAGPLTFFLQRLEARLGGKDWFVEDRLTVADLKVFVWVRTLRSGILDYVPTDLPEKHAPGLVAIADRIANHEKVQAYYAE